MSALETLPRAAIPFVEFAQVLRANGFAVAPEQTQAFIAGVGLLGPHSMTDIHRSARATLAPPPERADEFDALFRMIFLGQTLGAPAFSETDEDEVRAFDDREGDMEPPEADEEREAGGEAAGIERLTMRSFLPRDEGAALMRLRRRAAADLPRRASRRLTSAKTGNRLDMRRALAEAARRDGEVVTLPVRDRRMRQRRILLLIDISGSMKELTDGHLRFAHALTRQADRIEVFTLGTRLTRVTRALRRRNRDQALETAATLVADWDGGTRLGDALHAFLAVPRFAGFARGALTVVLSDGLERGDHAAMTDAVERLSRLSWAILWLTPLSDGRETFDPQTDALMSVSPFVDRFGSGTDVSQLTGEVLGFARRAA